MAQMTDCSTKKDPKERMDCIEKNVVTLNSAFETVTKELRNRLTELESALAKLEKGVLKPGDAVTIQGMLARDGSPQIWGDSVVLTASKKRVLEVSAAFVHLSDASAAGAVILV